MDKILSTRLDEAIIQRISNLAKQLNTSKKHVIEKSILLFASKIESEKNTDIMKQTFGSWDRKESAEQIVQKVREQFKASMRRHVD